MLRYATLCHEGRQKDRLRQTSCSTLPDLAVSHAEQPAEALHSAMLIKQSRFPLVQHVQTSDLFDKHVWHLIFWSAALHQAVSTDADTAAMQIPCSMSRLTLTQTGPRQY